MSRRILLADDSVTIQKVIELTFMDEDFAVTAVSNGDEALAQLVSVAPDLVIADVHMPGASGYEVCRRAKAWRPALPVLLLVGTFEPFDEGETAAAGADAHLKKPFDSQELLTLVQDLLARAPQAGSAAPAPAAAPSPAPAFAPPPAPAPAWAAPAPAPTAPPAPAPEPEPAPPSFDSVEAAWGSFALPDEPEAAAAPALHVVDPAAESPAAGRSAGFDWAETARFGRTNEPTFELEDTQDSGPALGLDDSLLQDAHDEPAGGGDIPFPQAPSAPAAGAAPAAHAHSFGEPFDRWSPEASANDLLPASDLAPAPAAMPFPTTPEERAGVPLGSEPLTAGLPEIEEHLHWAEERHEQPLAGAVAPGEPMASASPASAPAPSLAGLPMGSVSLPAQLSDDDVDRIARRVVELLGDKAVRDVAWEVVPDMAEVVIKDRLRELESQVE
jgi:CheY-like chemotaxis protein